MSERKQLENSFDALEATALVLKSERDAFLELLQELRFCAALEVHLKNKAWEPVLKKIDAALESVRP